MGSCMTEQPGCIDWYSLRLVEVDAVSQISVWQYRTTDHLCVTVIPCIDQESLLHLCRDGRCPIPLRLLQGRQAHKWLSYAALISRFRCPCQRCCHSDVRGGNPCRRFRDGRGRICGLLVERREVQVEWRMSSPQSLEGFALCEGFFSEVGDARKPNLLLQMDLVP